MRRSGWRAGRSRSARPASTYPYRRARSSTDHQSPASGIDRIGTIRRGRKGRPVTPAAARRPATANRSNRSLGPQRRGGATGEPERSQLPRDLRRPHAGMESTSPGKWQWSGSTPAIPAVLVGVRLTPDPREPRTCPTRRNPGTGRRRALPAGHAAPNMNNQDRIPTTKSYDSKITRPSD